MLCDVMSCDMPGIKQACPRKKCKGQYEYTYDNLVARLRMFNGKDFIIDRE